MRRSDSSGAADPRAHRAAVAGRGDRPACAHAAAGRTARARLDAAGDLIVLEEQDRGLWDRDQIAEALPLVEEALRGGAGPYRAAGGDRGPALPGGARGRTDWRQILGLYVLLERVLPSPVVTLNRAVAVAMATGTAAGAGASGRDSPGRTEGLPPPARRARGSAAPHWGPVRSGAELPAGPGPGHQRQRAPVPRTAAGRSYQGLLGSPGSMASGRK